MARIAIIDDSKASLDMLATILTESSYDVTPYSSGVGIEERFTTQPPDLVLLDIVMPDRNGYEILRSLKRAPETRDIPVILVSSKNEDTDVRWGKRQGAADYVTKPFTSDDILTAVRAHLP